VIAREIAEMVRKASKGFHLLKRHGSYEWSFEPAFPVRMFLERPVGHFVKLARGGVAPAALEDWMLFYEQERARNPEYYDALSAEWKASPEALGPVIVALLPNGRMDIGDGWHRVALSLILGRETIPAVVGVPKGG
jgi:hypothetical protein